MRLFRKLYRKLFFRFELQYEIGLNLWFIFYKFLGKKIGASAFYNTKDLAQAIEDFKNGK